MGATQQHKNRKERKEPDNKLTKKKATQHSRREKTRMGKKQGKSNQYHKKPCYVQRKLIVVNENYGNVSIVCCVLFADYVHIMNCLHTHFKVRNQDYSNLLSGELKTYL